MSKGQIERPNRSWIVYTGLAGPGVTVLTHWGIEGGMLPPSWSDAGPTVSLVVATGLVVAYHVDIWKEERQARAEAAGVHPPAKNQGSSPADHPHGDANQQD